MVNVLYSSRQLWQLWHFECRRVIILVAFYEWIHTKGEINHRHTSVTTQPNLTYLIVSLKYTFFRPTTWHCSFQQTSCATQKLRIGQFVIQTNVTTFLLFRVISFISSLSPNIHGDVSYDLTGQSDRTAATVDRSYVSLKEHFHC